MGGALYGFVMLAYLDVTAPTAARMPALPLEGISAFFFCNPW